MQNQHPLKKKTIGCLSEKEEKKREGRKKYERFRVVEIELCPRGNRAEIPRMSPSATPVGCKRASGGPLKTTGEAVSIFSLNTKKLSFSLSPTSRYLP